MTGTLFWLVALYDSTVALHAVEADPEQKTIRVVATGLTQSWEGTATSLTQAVEVSLSGCKQLLEDHQNSPSGKVAFILSPSWVGEDGKILSDKKQIIDYVCNQLQLQPMGFSSYDEALSEYLQNNQPDSLNLILAQVFSNYIEISLIVGGKIRERASTSFQHLSDLTPKLVESCLFQLKAAGILPSRMVIFGDVLDNQLFDQLIRHSWSGHGGRELFSQLPSLIKYNLSQIVQMYAEFIVGHLFAILPTVPSNIQPDDVNLPKPANQVINSISEVEPEALGFGSVPIIAKTEPEPKKFNLPKLSLPIFNFSQISFKKLPFFFLAIGLSLLGIFSFFFFRSSASLTLFVNSEPITVSKKVQLDSTITSLSVQKGLIPVNLKTKQIQVKANINTTGKKATGEKAKGEVVIFNKSEKSQTLAKGTVFKDSASHRFLLSNLTSISPAEPNLDTGVITMGQTKVILTAESIGPDNNLPKDTSLSIETSSTSLLAKVNQPFTGGTSRDIVVVSKEDKANIDQQLQEKIKTELNAATKKETDAPNILPSTLKIGRKHTDYSRQIDEEADTLEGTIDANVSVFALSENVKKELISGYLQANDNFSNLQIDPKKVNLNFVVSSQDDKQAIGTLTLSGQAIPKLDTSTLAKNLRFQSTDNLKNIISKFSNRIYDYKIDQISTLLKVLKHLPPSSARIQLDISGN